MKNLITLTLLFSLGYLHANTNQKGLSLETAYDQFVTNIKNRKFENAKTYVNDSDSIQFSDAGGNVLLTMEEYDAQLIRFTQDTGWTSYTSEIINVKQLEDTGVIMERAKISGEGWEFNMIVTYVFQEIDGYWKLITDICTKVE